MVWKEEIKEVARKKRKHNEKVLDSILWLEMYEISSELKSHTLEIFIKKIISESNGTSIFKAVLSQEGALAL